MEILAPKIREFNSYGPVLGNELTISAAPEVIDCPAVEQFAVCTP